MKYDSSQEFLAIPWAKKSETNSIKLSVCVHVICHTLHTHCSSPRWLSLVQPYPTWGAGQLWCNALKCLQSVLPFFFQDHLFSLIFRVVLKRSTTVHTELSQVWLCSWWHHHGSFSFTAEPEMTLYSWQDVKIQDFDQLTGFTALCFVPLIDSQQMLAACLELLSGFSHFAHHANTETVSVPKVISRISYKSACWW